jgi:hypothetical protein
MDYVQAIHASASDPKALEDLYQAARRDKHLGELAADLRACYQESPDNILYAAWFYRLSQPDQAESRSINWQAAIPLAALVGLIFAVLARSPFSAAQHAPFLVYAWSAIAACFLIAFLAVTARRDPKRAWGVIAGLTALTAYAALFITLTRREQYELLMVLHLPLLAWIGTGAYVLGTRPDARNRFAFLIKSVEVFVTGGLYTLAGGLFAAITFGLFQAIGVQIPTEAQQSLVAGGGGLITLLAVASVYDPHLNPIEQAFEQGLGRLIPTLTRLLLPLTLIVLVVYLCAIPFNFMQPFRNRDVLIVYNAGLFAVMALLVGVTPVREQDLAQKYHRVLRAGILAVAILAALISGYALSATVYRTALGGLTANRVAIIGWNTINISLLAALIFKQFRDGSAAWIRSAQSVFSGATVAYTGWTLFLIVATPLLFK